MLDLRAPILVVMSKQRPVKLLTFRVKIDFGSFVMDRLGRPLAVQRNTDFTDLCLVKSSAVLIFRINQRKSLIFRGSVVTKHICHLKSLCLDNQNH